jgi:hypothetical protein
MININYRTQEILVFCLGALIAFGNHDCNEDVEAAMQVIKKIKDDSGLDFSTLSKRERIVIIDAVSYCVEEWDFVANNPDYVTVSCITEIAKKLIKPFDSEVAYNIIEYMKETA